MNLVSLAMQYLAPVVLNRIASSLGIGQGLVGKAISAAIPSILAGLAGSAAKPGGASALGNVLSKIDPGMLSNLGNLIGGAGQQQLVDGGSSALSSLLGGGSAGALASAVGKFAGIDSGKTASLMGILAPVVLGTLAKEQKSSGLDAAGLANLLQSQKSNITAALPAGFSDLLAGSGLLDSVTGSMKAAGPAPAPMPEMAPVPASGGGLGKWLLALAAALAALYLLSTYGGNRAPVTEKAPEKPAATAPAENTPAPAEKAAPAPKSEAPAAPAGQAADLAGLATKAIGALTGSLGSITDEATAKAAVPALQDTSKQIDGLKAAALLLQGDARKPLAALVAAALPSLTAAVEKATGIPGVAAIINPLVQPMLANLTAITK